MNALKTTDFFESALGRIGYHKTSNSPTGHVPLVFLHGVFLDKSLWQHLQDAVTDRLCVYVDMPGHGDSGPTPGPWHLEDCVTLLMDLLDELKLEKVGLVGQSWGSMVGLRAAHRYPERFERLLLCNTPTGPVSGRQRLGFKLQQMISPLKGFYGAQAAKSLYAPQSLAKHPEWSYQMRERLKKHDYREIQRTLQAVILDAEDSSALSQNVKVPIMALRGEQDYVAPLQGAENKVVPGGHISPHEAPEALKIAMRSWLLAEKEPTDNSLS